MAILLFGGPNLPALVTLGNTTLEKVIVRNTSAVDFLGSAVAIADFDGDSKKDLVVGADGVDGPAGPNCGAAYVFYSAAELPPSFRVDDIGISRTVIVGSSAQTWWGNGLCSADFDFDGRDDIMLRCASADYDEATRDTVAVLYGRGTRPDTIRVSNDLELSKFASEFFDEHLGRDTAALDMGNDGLRDLVLSAHGYDSHRGRLFVVFGPATTGIGRTPGAQHFLRVIPNPFSDSTRLTFTLQSHSLVRVVIHDVLGRVVSVLNDASLPVGDHSLVWSGRDRKGRLVAQGVYFVRIETPTGTAVQKLTLVR